MHAAFILSLLAAAATAAPTTSVEALNLAKRIVARAPEDAKAVLKSVTSSGSGCASNSAGFIFSDNASVAFDAMVVQTEDPAEANKNCRFTIDIQTDPTWKYTINKKSVAQGYTDGAWANFKAVYTVGGKTSTSQGNIPSPEEGGSFSLVLFNDGATSALGGGVATLDVSLALQRKEGRTGFLSLDSLDITFDYTQ